jgi:hypothetical protein
MKCRNLASPAVVVALLFVATQRVTAQHATEVVSYSPGSTANPNFAASTAALGEPARFTGEGVFPSVVSPFSPPFMPNEIVSIGESGHITLRLSHYAIPVAGPEIGVFENLGLADVSYPSGIATSPAATFGPLDGALVEVSEDGTAWESLGNFTFDVPTNGFTDLTDAYSTVPGTGLSDFQQPFVGSLSSFDGLPYYNATGPDMLELLGGSGGGTWLDISGTGLARVGFIRFSIADDGTGTALNLELDAVSIARAAVGGVVPEPMSAALALMGAIGLLQLRRRRS